MSKLGINKRGYEWAVMELHPKKGLLWLTSIPCQQGKKVSVYGKVAPLRRTRGRSPLVIFFVQFNKEPNARREFFESLKRHLDGFERNGLRFHYAELDAGIKTAIDPSKIITITANVVASPAPSTFNGNFLL